MSDKFSRDNYDRLKAEFEKVTKKINNYENRQLPSDETERQVRIETYVAELIESYNDFITYAKKFYSTFNTESKNTITDHVSSCNLKVLRSLSALKLTTDLPQKFEKLRKYR